jgi:hypothetical protein
VERYILWIVAKAWVSNYFKLFSANSRIPHYSTPFINQHPFDRRQGFLFELLPGIDKSSPILSVAILAQEEAKQDEKLIIAFLSSFRSSDGEPHRRWHEVIRRHVGIPRSDERQD